MADLTDDELLEQLSANTDCGCLTCRMVHEIQRRRAAHVASTTALEALVDLREDSRHEEVALAVFAICDLAASLKLAEGK